MSEAKRYTWNPGRHPNAPAGVVGAWIEKLPDRRPETIVAMARSKSSPVHSYLWDIGEREAAHEHRLLLARLMLSALRVDVVVYRRNKPHTIQAQAVMRSTNTGDYDYIDVAMSEPAKRDFILAQAMAKLQAMRRQYAHLSELAVVFAAIDRVQTRVMPRKKA